MQVMAPLVLTVMFHLMAAQTMTLKRKGSCSSLQHFIVIQG